SLGGASQLIPALIHLGYSYGQFGDYTQAIATLQEGLSAVVRSPNKRFEAYLLLNLADIQRYRDTFHETLENYHRALERLRHSEPSLRCTILAHFSTLHRWQGNLPEAVYLAEQAFDLSAKHNFRMEANVAQIALWAARAEAGTPDQSLQNLEQIAEDLGNQHEQFALLRALGLCAFVSLLISDKTAASRNLRAAFELALALGTTQPLLSEVLHAPLLESFLNANAKQ